MGYWTLLEKGNTLLLNSGGKDYINSNLEELFKEMKFELYNLNTSIVHDAARIVIEKQIKKDEFNKIKEFALENNIKLDVVFDLLGIYLNELASDELRFRNYD